MDKGSTNGEQLIFSFKAGSLPAPAMSLHGVKKQAVASQEYKQQTSGTRNCA